MRERRQSPFHGKTRFKKTGGVLLFIHRSAQPPPSGPRRTKGGPVWFWLFLCAGQVAGADLTYPGDATIPGGIADGTVTVGGQLTTYVTGGTVYAGSLIASEVTGGDIHVTGYTQVTTMTAGIIEAGSLEATTISGGSIHVLGDSRITTLSVATVIIDGAGVFTTISSGIVTVHGAATITTLSAGTVTLNGDVMLTTLSAGSLRLNGPTARILAINGGTIDLGATNLTLTGGIVAGTFTGGTGTITKEGADTLTFAQPNTVEGTLLITDGIVDLGDFAQSFGLMRLAGGSLRNGRLNGLHFALEAGQVMATMEGAGRVSKTTEGAVTLSALNTYSGGTTVSAGTLTVTHADGLGTGAVEVSGGTLVVDADLTNAVAAGSGGTVSGAGSLGQLTLGAGSTFSPGGMSSGLSPGGLQVSGGATLVWRVSAPSLGAAGYDSPVVNGVLDLSQASPSNRITVRIVSLAHPGDIVPGAPLGFSRDETNRFVFLTYDSPLNMGANGDIADLFTYDLSEFRYSDGTSSDAALWSMSFDDTSGQLTLTAVPEPSTYALALGALALAIAAVRRRRRDRQA